MPQDRGFAFGINKMFHAPLSGKKSRTQGIDTDESNPTSRLMLNLLGAFAEFERELIVERTRAGLQRARRAGRIGGRPRLVVNRARVTQMDADGMTMREIGEELFAIVNVVHDALYGLVPESRLFEVIPRVRYLMEHPPDLPFELEVPLEVETKIGKNLGIMLSLDEWCRINGRMD